MGIFDWLGPTAFGKRRGWDALPAQPASSAREQRVLDLSRPRSLLVDGVPSYWTPLVPTTAAAVVDNSAVFACLSLIATSLTEPPIKVYRVSSGERVELDNQPVADLLARPNPYLTLRALLGSVSDSLHVDGNAYWRKVRSGDPLRGNVIQLWPINPSEIAPYTRPGSTDFVTHYTYTPSGHGSETLATENVVHFRYGLDPADHRLGYAPLKRLVREVASDAQATRYAERLLANLAINGLTLSFDKDTERFSQADAEEMKARIAAAFGGDNVGSVAVVGPGGTLSALGFSPEQMDLRVLHQVPEERIAAVLGVPAVVVGLGAGLEHSIYNNVRQAEEHFTERKLGALWADIADTLTLQLLPDFTADRSLRLDFDTTHVRALSDDQDALATRLKTLVEAGILTADEARAQIGYDPAPAQPTAPAETRGRPYLLRLPGERKAAEDLVDRYDAIRTAELPLWERELLTFLDRQLGRVTRRLRAGVDTAADLVTDGEAVLLGETLAPLQLRLLDEVSRAVVSELAIQFTVDDPATRAYLADAGANIVGITGTTRSAVQDALITGQAEGEGIEQLARRLRDLPAFGPARARTVARSELGTSQNLAALSSYTASGVVVGVRVMDGDYDAACQAMNGRTFPLDRPPAALQHPNCTRALVPLLSAEDLEAAG